MSRSDTSDNRPISALKVPDSASLAPDLKEHFDECTEKLGFVPNVLRAYSLRPDRLRGFMAIRDDIFRGDMGITKLEREMIGVVVSCVNRCYYCLSSHGNAVRYLSKDPELGEMLIMNYRVAKLAPRHRAMLDFAWKMTETPDRVTEEDRQALRAAGFGDEDIFDICCVVGFFNMTNRIATGAEIMPNEEYMKGSR